MAWDARWPPLLSMPSSLVALPIWAIFNTEVDASQANRVKFFHCGLEGAGQTATHAKRPHRLRLCVRRCVCQRQQCDCLLPAGDYGVGRDVCRSPQCAVESADSSQWPQLRGMHLAIAPARAVRLHSVKYGRSREAHEPDCISPSLGRGSRVGRLLPEIQASRLPGHRERDPSARRSETVSHPAAAARTGVHPADFLLGHPAQRASWLTTVESEPSRLWRKREPGRGWPWWCRPGRWSAERREPTRVSRLLRVRRR
jgi:hypothetical protein